MAWNKRVSALALIVLLSLPAPLGSLELWAGPAEATFPGEIFNNTFDIANPAFLYMSMWWTDGGFRSEVLNFQGIFVVVGGDGHAPRLMSSNPMPVEPNSSVRITVYPHDVGTNGYILWDNNYTSGAAGSYHVANVDLNMQTLFNSTYYPVRVQFRPFDFSTGVGLPIEQFNITIQFGEECLNVPSCSAKYLQSNETPIGGGFLNTYYGFPITVRTRDYFGNLLYNETRTLRMNQSTFCVPMSGVFDPGVVACGLKSDSFYVWDIPLTVYSVKFYNQKPDQFTKFALHWNGTGAGEEVFAPNSGIQPPWWNSQWTYRDRIRVAVNADVRAGYDLNLTLAAAPYIAAGKMQNDLRDLRVVYLDPETGLWREANRTYNGTSLHFKAQGPQPMPDSTSSGSWHFEEGAGTTTADSSGSGNVGTLTNGPTWVVGRYGVGYAVNFDGVDDYISVPDSASNSLTGSLTLSAWIKTNTAGAQQGIIEKYDQSSTPKGGYGLRLTSAGKLFGFTIDAAGAATTLTGATTISTGVWHHVSYTFDGANNYLYLDGIQDATGTNTRNPANSDGTLKIGARGEGAAAATFNGAIDDARIYNFARAANQVACDATSVGCIALNSGVTSLAYYLYYGNPLAGSAPTFSTYSQLVLSTSGVTAYWKLDETTVVPAADSTGNGHDGTYASTILGQPGIIDNAVLFPTDTSTSERVGIPAFKTPLSFTTEAWVKISGTSAEYRNVIGNRQAGGGANGDAFLYIVQNQRTLRPHVRQTGGGFCSMDTTELIPLNEWTLLTQTWDDASKELQVFINGAQSSVAKTCAQSHPQQTLTWSISADQGDGRSLTGYADSVAIYSNALLPDAIKARYLQAQVGNATLSLDSSPGFAWFNSPGETVERFLNPGYYEVTITTDNRTGLQSKATLGFNVSEANYFMVSGTNITRFIGDFFSIYSQTVQIQNAFRPDVVHIGTLLPSAPTDITPPMDANFVLIHPFSILTGTEAYAAASSANATLYQPSFASSSGDGSLLATITVTKDTFVFTGNPTAHVWINYTNGTTIWENASLPPSVTLPGTSGDVYVVSNQSVATTRISDFKAIWEFSFRYYPSTKRYEQSLTLNNTMNRTVINPKWFVGFPDNRTVDLSTAAVEDLDNVVWLSRGQNFDVTASGFYMVFQQLNASVIRSFFFVFYDSNATALQSTPVLQVDTIERTTYRGSTAFWTGAATWANPFTSPYAGEIVIKFTCSECSKIRAETIVVVDETSGRTLDATEWFGSGDAVHITAAAVGSVVVGGAKNYRLYFQLQLEPGKASVKFFDPLIDIAGFGVSIALIVFGATVAMVAKAAFGGSKSKSPAERAKLQGNWWNLSFGMLMVSVLLVVGHGIGYIA